MTSVTKNFFNLSASQRPTVGDTKLSMVNYDHMGWFLCDGRTLQISDYQILYNVLGTSYGSNGSTTFKLPNPAGRVLGVIGTGSNLTPRIKGAAVGEETHTLNIGEMPTHNHTGTTSNASTGITLNNGENVANTNKSDALGPALTNVSVDSGDNANLSISDPGHNHDFTTNDTGGSNAHNNMQPTLFLGNLFVFTGKGTRGTYPYTVGANVY